MFVQRGSVTLGPLCSSSLLQAGPCHNGMARPQVVDGRTASNMEGSCEYIELAVADSRQGVVLQLGVWARR